MRLGDLLDGCDGTVQYVRCDADTDVDGLAVDSRAVAPGDAFLALIGATHDGHAYAEQVVQAGARVLLVQRGHGTPPVTAHVLLDDTTAAYPIVAANRFGRPAERLKLAGVTGTNGKTTVAHLVGGMLAAADVPHLRLGTTGNWIVDEESKAAFTTPFPLELQGLLADAVRRGATAGVMEVSSHALEQGRARPIAYAAVGMTSFSQDHLDFHPTMDAYLEAKCRLAREHLRPDGVAVAAVDDQPAAARFLDAAASPRRWRASRGAIADAELIARDIVHGSDGMSARIDTPSGSLELRSPLIGAFNLDNLLVAIGLALGLGVDLATIEGALPGLRGAPGRLERVATDGAHPLVVVDYAHTPDAVARALTTLRELCHGRLLVVLGCGGDRDRSKRPLMGRVAAEGSDRFWATSDNPRTEDPDAIVDDMLAGVPEARRGDVVRCTDRASAIADAIAAADASDVVLIAGKGHEDYQILGTRRIHFDDREHALAALRRS